MKQVGRTFQFTEVRNVAGESTEPEIHIITNAVRGIESGITFGGVLAQHDCEDVSMTSSRSSNLLAVSQPTNPQFNRQRSVSKCRQNFCLTREDNEGWFHHSRWLYCVLSPARITAQKFARMDDNLTTSDDKSTRVPRPVSKALLSRIPKKQTLGRLSSPSMLAKALTE